MQTQYLFFAVFAHAKGLQCAGTYYVNRAKTVALTKQKFVLFHPTAMFDDVIEQVDFFVAH
ncbi:hypothetical protein D3C80_2217710 [compost metagenome]